MFFLLLKWAQKKFSAKSLIKHGCVLGGLAPKRGQKPVPGTYTDRDTCKFFGEARKRNKAQQTLLKKSAETSVSTFWNNDLWIHTIYNTPIALLLQHGIYPGNEMFLYGTLLPHETLAQQWQGGHTNMVAKANDGFQ